MDSRNEFKVVGTLMSADVKFGNYKSNGAGYVTVTTVVKSNIGGKDREYEINFKANQLTTQGVASKLFDTYSKLPDLVNKKVEISGEIVESRFFSSNAGQLISTQKLAGKWVKGVLPTAVDEGSFTVTGFIVKTLVERKNKANEIYRYDLMIGQETYEDSGKPQMLTLHVDPTATNVVTGVKQYNVGQTVKFAGSLDFFTELVTKQEDSAFGTITKTYSNTQKNFFIEAGSHPFTADQGAFDQAKIATLIEAYKANDTTLMQKKEAVADAPVVNEAPVTKRQTSLI